MKVTLNFLEKQNACENGIVQFEKVFGKSAELKDAINHGIKTKDKLNLEYCNWLIVRKMTHRQKIQYAVFAAEQVLNLFEKEYSDDRPRKAIEAAKKVLKQNNIYRYKKAKNPLTESYHFYKIIKLWGNSELLS